MKVFYSYAKKELDEWVPKVEETAAKVKKVFGYFNNHFHGYAPENCLHMIERLGLQNEEQKKIREKARQKQSNLGDFMRRSEAS